MLFWRRRQRRCLDLTGPAIVYLARSGAYTAPTWDTGPTRVVSTVGVPTRGQATGYQAGRLG